MLSSVTFWVMLVYLPLYFQVMRGMSPWAAGLMLLPLTVPLLLLAPLGAKLAAPSSLGARGLMILGCLLPAIGLVWLAVAPVAGALTDLPRTANLIAVGDFNSAVSGAPVAAQGALAEFGKASFENAFSLIMGIVAFLAVLAVICAVFMIRRSDLPTASPAVTMWREIEILNKLAESDILNVRTIIFSSCRDDGQFRYRTFGVFKHCFVYKNL